MNVERLIFKRGSTSYYWSSQFFPKKMRHDVFKLYSFVRVVDDLVDEYPQDLSGLTYVNKSWESKHITGTSVILDRVLNNIMDLAIRYEFEDEWVDDFLQSMIWDSESHHYAKLSDSLKYVHGSAEVVGLMMSAILGLPSNAIHAAKLQGRAMQWINFCRDIQEDITLGRCHFPDSDLRKFDLPNLNIQTVRTKNHNFEQFMGYQLDRYESWQHEADLAYHYIPARLRIPIRTARDMYMWTASEIRKNPFAVYERKIKPSKTRVISRAVGIICNG